MLFGLNAKRSDMRCGQEVKSVRNTDKNLHSLYAACTAAVVALFASLFLLLSVASTVADEQFKVNWMAISDHQELSKTWKEALVYLPEQLGGLSGRLLRGKRFDEILSQAGQEDKWPLILFLHYCEGLRSVDN